MKTFDLEVQWMNPAELTPYPLNNKKHTIEQIDELAGLIATFGFDQPIVVDENLIILKGHCRREASLRLKLELVPVIIRDDLTEEEKKAARLSDNTIVGEEWNIPAISLELETLSRKKFDLNKIGLNSTSNSTLKSFLEARQKVQEELEKEKDTEYTESKEYFGGDYESPGSIENSAPQNRDLASSSIKTVQLFFNSITFNEFEQLIKELNEKYQTNNTTDCILESLRRYNS